MNTNAKRLAGFLAGSAVGVAAAVLIPQVLVLNANADMSSAAGLLAPPAAARILGDAQRVVILTPSHMRQDKEARQVMVAPEDVMVIVDLATGCQYLAISSPQLPGSGRIGLGLRWDADGKPMCGNSMVKRGS